LLPLLRKALGRLSGTEVYLKTVVVDLTPYPAPGPNGVDAAMAQSWLRALSEVQPLWRWILLTAPEQHEFFAGLESSRMRRRPTPPPPSEGLRQVMPAKPASRLRRGWKRLLRLLGLPRPPAPMSTATLLRRLRADALFCPFGSTYYHDCTVPTVVLWNDYTHLHYPQFLPPESRVSTAQALQQALHVADQFVCFSGQARAQILKAEQVETRRVIALRIRSMQHWPRPNRALVNATLERHGLVDGKFVLYPGGFTECHNHKLLLVALGMAKNRHPHDELQIVCTGPSSASCAELGKAAASMGLAKAVVFVATDSAEEQAALLEACRAVFFPSLCGPLSAVLLHALEFSKPIICSSQAHIPDIVRDAALFFDPKKPAELVDVLHRAAADEGLLSDLTRQGRHQATTLCSPRDTAMQLVDVFQEAMATSRRYTDSVKGIYHDGWTSERIVLTWSPSEEGRTVRLTLRGADWLPWSHQRVRLLKDHQQFGKVIKLMRGQTLTIEHELPAAGGHLEFLFDPPASPHAVGLGGDNRLLGCMCTECVILGKDADVLLHTTETAAV
jgi:glycosyltransferase involved in cell wall biosynthesis